MALKGRADLDVVSVVPLGIEIPMYDITTGTGDFIANGVVSHNCFARPRTRILDLDTGEDFEPKIVVKVNAVERLRAELDPRRWRGEHIAMGTNTDPYQRCEGKYRLTRGIVGVLGERGEPVLDPHEVDADPAGPRPARRGGRAHRRARELLDRHARRGGLAQHRAGHAPPRQRVEAVRQAQRGRHRLRRAGGADPARAVRRPRADRGGGRPQCSRPAPCRSSASCCTCARA